MMRTPLMLHIQDLIDYIPTVYKYVVNTPLVYDMEKLDEHLKIG